MQQEVCAVQRELLEQLREITEEERRILNGEAEVDRDLYTSGSDFTIDSNKMLEEGKLIATAPIPGLFIFPFTAIIMWKYSTYARELLRIL